MAMTWTDVLERAVLDALDAVGGPLEGAEIALYKAGPGPSGGMALADFEEADFTGYARVPIGLGTIHTDEDGAAELTQYVEFVATGSATTNTVEGVMIVNAADDAVLMAEAFAEPVPVTQAADVVQHLVRIKLNQA